MKMALKRKWIQWASVAVSNANFPNFFKGTIDKGNLKGACVPGLNCYSCPGAIASCPIGSLQAVLGSYKYQFSYYVVGILLAFGVIFGRWICGFLCPFGLFQELLHKIPTPKFKLPPILSYVKYAILLVFVIWMPLFVTNFMGMGQPAFCQYICPAGTLEGGIPLLGLNPELRQTIGWLFTLKMSILVATVVGCMLYYRGFCRVLCPLGAIYSFFNSISFVRLHLDQTACTSCGKCARTCKMDVAPYKSPDAPECIRCGECVTQCPQNALNIGIQKNKAVVSVK